MRKPLLVVLAVLVVAGAICLGLAQRCTGPAVRTTEEVITVPGGVTSPGSVSIDTTLYVPAAATAANPAPAVVVSPGFGSDKTGVDSDARDLAAHGYVALTWSLRGFGKIIGDGPRLFVHDRIDDRRLVLSPERELAGDQLEEDHAE